MKVIGIVGSRTRYSSKDYLSIEKQVLNIQSFYQEQIFIISGGCYRGADKFAEEIADYHKIPKEIDKYKPKYNIHGRAATFIRNDLIAKDADILIACVSSDRKGGTEDTIRKFKRYHPDGKLVII